MFVNQDQNASIGFEDRLDPDRAEKVDGFEPPDEGGHRRVVFPVISELLGEAIFKPSKHATSPLAGSP